MSMMQLFSALLIIISMLGIYGSLQVNLVYKNTIGSGVMPLICSVILLLLAVFTLLQGRKEPKIEWKKQMQPPVVDAWVFYIANIVMFILLYYFGTIPAILIFSIGTILCLKRMKIVSTLIFSVSWVLALYLLFVVYLGVRFATGVVFQ
jgi:hypothetical protein